VQALDRGLNKRHHFFPAPPDGQAVRPNGHAIVPDQNAPKGPRILIASASVGSGHVRAAEAIALALRRQRPDAFVRAVDVLALASRPFRWSYAQVYLDLIQHAPPVIGYIYDRIDRPVLPRSMRWYHLRVFLETMNVRPFVRLLCDEPWDLVINTFFLPAEIVAGLKCNGKFNAPQVMVTTDFETHRNWAVQPCEHFFTATDEAGPYLEFFGVPAGTWTTTGIPVHPVFSEPKDPRDCRARQGLAGDRPVILLLAGGHGAGPIEGPYRALLDVETPLEVVVVTGHNELARKNLEGIQPPARHRVHVLGYTTQMDELLAAADLVVTKPGGLTVSEALARGAGLVVVNPIPGQEERNSDFLLENGAAIKANHLPTLGRKLTALLADPGRLARLKANARRLARPRAAFDIAARSLALAGAGSRAGAAPMKAG
jgi:processive 1,2-diacylglycerol beta-glucosyltransferase